jgi:hypothetical protein
VCPQIYSTIVNANQFFPSVASHFLRWRIIYVNLPLKLKFNLMPLFPGVGFLWLAAYTEAFVWTLLHYVCSEALAVAEVKGAGPPSLFISCITNILYCETFIRDSGTGYEGLVRHLASDFWVPVSCDRCCVFISVRAGCMKSGLCLISERIRSRAVRQRFGTEATWN